MPLRCVNLQRHHWGVVVPRLLGSEPLVLYLLGFYFMDGGVRKAVVMEKAHLLVQQAVNNVSSGVLPLHQANEVPV